MNDVEVEALGEAQATSLPREPISRVMAITGMGAYLLAPLHEPLGLCLDAAMQCSVLSCNANTKRTKYPRFLGKLWQNSPTYGVNVVTAERTLVARTL